MSEQIDGLRRALNALGAVEREHRDDGAFETVVFDVDGATVTLSSEYGRWLATMEKDGREFPVSWWVTALKEPGDLTLGLVEGDSPPGIDDFAAVLGQVLDRSEELLERLAPVGDQYREREKRRLS